MILHSKRLSCSAYAWGFLLLQVATPALRVSSFQHGAGPKLPLFPSKHSHATCTPFDWRSCLRFKANIRLHRAVARSAQTEDWANLGTEQKSGRLILTDKETGTRVCLVSTMHYNPASIMRVVDTVDALAAERRLAAVVIESCSTRYGEWKHQPALWRRAILTSEMQIAAERAKVAGVEFILGDQPIEELVARTNEIFLITLKDLSSPLDGGWVRCAEDIFKAGESVLSSFSVSPSAPTSFDLAILLAAPISIIRYALAWVVGSPLAVVALAFGTATCWLLPDTLGKMRSQAILSVRVKILHTCRRR